MLFSLGNQASEQTLVVRSMTPCQSMLPDFPESGLAGNFAFPRLPTSLCPAFSVLNFD